MTPSGVGLMATSAFVLFVLAATVPRLAGQGDSGPNAYWVPSSAPDELRDEFRGALAARNTFRREALGWKYSTPPRSLMFRSCRAAEGPAVDADMDGEVDNLVAANRWRKDWAVHDPAVADPDWSTLTSAEREAALALARRQVGVGTDFGRRHEPSGSNCDQPRSAVSNGRYYWPN